MIKMFYEFYSSLKNRVFRNVKLLGRRVKKRSGVLVGRLYQTPVISPSHRDGLQWIEHPYREVNSQEPGFIQSIELILELIDAGRTPVIKDTNPAGLNVLLQKRADGVILMN